MSSDRESPARGTKTASVAGVERALDLLGGLLITCALVLFFRARGQHGQWLLLALWLPSLRLLGSPLYRARFHAGFLRQWAKLCAYHRDGLETPWGAVFALVMVPAAVFYLGSGSVPGPGNGDTTPVVPTAVRFITHGDLRLDEHIGDAHSPLLIKSADQLPYYVRQTPSGLYSNYPAGMTVFALPAVAVSHMMGADWHRPATAGRIEKWTGAWLAAASVGLFCLICLRLAAPAPALVCTALVALASSVFSTASQDLSQQGGVVFWMLLILWIEVRSNGRPSAMGIVMQALACGFAPACRVSAVLLVASFLLWVLLRSPRRAIATGLLSLLAFAPWGIFYWTVYHSLLGPTEGQATASAWTAVPCRNLAGVLVSPGRGLLVYHPWLLALLLLPWSPRLAWPASLRGMPWFLAGAVVLHKLLVSSWGMWWGGDSWGPRLMTETVPLLALLALPAVASCCEKRAARAVLVSLGIAGVWMHVAGTYFDGVKWNTVPLNVDEHPERLWDWREPPFLYPVFHHVAAGGGQ